MHHLSRSMINLDKYNQNGPVLAKADANTNKNKNNAEADVNIADAVTWFPFFRKKDNYNRHHHPPPSSPGDDDRPKRRTSIGKRRSYSTPNFAKLEDNNAATALIVADIAAASNQNHQVSHQQQHYQPLSQGRHPSIPTLIHGKILMQDIDEECDEYVYEYDDQLSIVSEITHMTYSAERAELVMEEFFRRMMEMQKSRSKGNVETKLTLAEKETLLREIQQEQDSKLKRMKQEEKGKTLLQQQRERQLQLEQKLQLIQQKSNVDGSKEKEKLRQIALTLNEEGDDENSKSNGIFERLHGLRLQKQMDESEGRLSSPSSDLETEEVETEEELNSNEASCCSVNDCSAVNRKKHADDGGGDEGDADDAHDVTRLKEVNPYSLTHSNSNPLVSSFRSALVPNHTNDKDSEYNRNRYPGNWIGEARRHLQATGLRMSGSSLSSTRTDKQQSNLLVSKKSSKIERGSVEDDQQANDVTKFYWEKYDDEVVSSLASQAASEDIHLENQRGQQPPQQVKDMEEFATTVAVPLRDVEEAGKTNEMTASSNPTHLDDIIELKILVAEQQTTIDTLLTNLHNLELELVDAKKRRPASSGDSDDKDDDHQLKVKTLEMENVNLKNQLEQFHNQYRERDASWRDSQDRLLRDFDEELHMLEVRNIDLTRDNSELRHRLRELEKQKL